MHIGRLKSSLKLTAHKIALEITMTSQHVIRWTSIMNCILANLLTIRVDCTTEYTTGLPCDFYREFVND